MAIPQDKLDALRDGIDLAGLIGAYLQLKPAGRNFKGLCPFHREKTPSFIVSPDKGIYHCFGCHKGGNAFNFIMEMESLGFVEAVKFLAERYHFPLDFSASGPSPDAEVLYQANGLAAAFYHKHLLSPAGAPVRQYLAKRGITPESTVKFSLGYAPEGWDSLRRHLEAKAIPPAMGVRAGLLSQNEKGDIFDRFRQRLIFPIHKLSGQVAGLGGRALAKEQEPKYLNSPESEIYHKGRELYALYHGREAVRTAQQAFLVEGYMDAIGLFQAGVENVVAGSGTAFTLDQALLIKRFCPQVVIAYDGDEAGHAAALRSLAILLEAGLQVRLLTLPAGQDPDTYVLANGAAAFRDLARQSLDFVTYLQRQSPESGLPEPEARSRLVRRVTELCLAIPDPVLKNEYLAWAAKVCGTPLRLVQEAAERLAGGARARPARAPAGPEPAAAPLKKWERNVLQELLLRENPEPELRAAVSRWLETGPLPGPFGAILRAWERSGGRGGKLLDELEPGLRSGAAELMAGETGRAPAPVEKLVARLQEARITQEMDAIRARLAQGDQDPALLERLNQLSHQRKKPA